MLWRRDCAAGSRREVALQLRRAGKCGRVADRAVPASISQLRRMAARGQEAAAPTASPRPSWQSQNCRCHQPSPAVNSATRTWRGKRGREKPFWFRSLALIALCSPGEVLVSTSPGYNRAVSKEQECTPGWVTLSSAARPPRNTTPTYSGGMLGPGAPRAHPACSTGLQHQPSTLWVGERSSPEGPAGC